ncbi:MAG: ABC transporter substrate-binding protein [Desulfobacterales bacterium]|nr:ABC transporter substrate-binding protein [Desulfobacterales bacterium]
MRNRPHHTTLRTLLLLIAIPILHGCPSGEKRPPQSPPIKLSLAVHPAPYSGLIAIAHDQGHFKAAGLAVSMDPYPSGRDAMEAVLRGQAQAATVSDASFAVKALGEPSLRVLASIGSTTVSQIVARKDRGIRTPSDLKGKRVGFSAGTTTDYFLYAFLIMENIAPAEIMAVNIPAARQAEAVVSGEVDAVCAFARDAFTARKRLGANATLWDPQNNLAYHCLLAARQAPAGASEPLRRLMEALIEAETFAVANEAGAQAILARHWGLDPAFLRETWPGTRISVSFGQSIVISLDNFFQWHLRKTGGNPNSVDVLAFLDTGALEAAAPQLITLFR